VEHYLFGFGMITLTLLAWLRLGDRTSTKERV
jgi:hypothetical protein